MLMALATRRLMMTGMMMNQNQSTRVLGASETTGRDENLFRMPNGDEHEQNGDAGGAGHEVSLLVGLAVGPRARGGSRETAGAVLMGGREGGGGSGCRPCGGDGKRGKREVRAGVKHETCLLTIIIKSIGQEGSIVGVRYI